jgi:hypothetical protein
MSAIGAKVLAKVESWEGIHESPAHSNRGPGIPGVSFFEEHDFVAGEGYPWCVCTVLSAYELCGHKLPYLTPGAWALLAWHEQHTPSWVVHAPNKLTPGCICVWNEGSGHASTFKSYDAKRKVIVTVDGNWGAQVQQVEHPVSQLRGAIIVPDNPQTHPAKTTKPPTFDLATSHNGHIQIVATATGPKIAKRAAAWALNKANLGKTFAVRRHGKKSI